MIMQMCRTVRGDNFGFDKAAKRGLKEEENGEVNKGNEMRQQQSGECKSDIRVLLPDLFSGCGCFCFGLCLLASFLPSGRAFQFKRIQEPCLRRRRPGPN